MTVQDVNGLMKLAITNLQASSGFFGSSSSQVSRFGVLVLAHLPNKISRYIRKVMNRPELPPIADVPEEFQIITQILIKTLYLHGKDEPLPFSQFG